MISLSKYSNAIAPLAVVLSLTACGDSDSDASGAALERGDARAAGTVDLATAQLALQELTTNVDVTVTGFGSANPAATSASVSASGAAAETTLNMRCAGGGDANVGGYVNVTPLPVFVDVKVAIAYDACITSSGTAIAGDIDFSQTVAAGPGTPLRVETLYQGDVVLTGKVNASCPVDLNVLVDETGRALQIGGSFCGHDASALSVQLNVAPRWSAN